MDDIESLHHRWIEDLWNEGREDVIDELLDEDCIAFYPYFVKSDEPIRGRKKFKEFFRLVWENFSRMNIETLDLVVEDNKAISFLLVKAEQKSADPGGGTVSEQAELKCLCQLKVENGRIVEIWNNVDLSRQNPKAALLKL